MGPTSTVEVPAMHISFPHPAPKAAPAAAATEAIRTLQNVTGIVALSVVASAAISAVVTIGVMQGLRPASTASGGAVIRAQTVEVTQPDGTVVATLGSLSPGVVGLGIWDDAGRLRVSLALQPGDAPALVLQDEQGNERVTLGVPPDGESAGLTVTDEIGIPHPAVGAAQAEVGPDEFSSDAALPLDPGGSALHGEGEEFVLSETEAPS